MTQVYIHGSADYHTLIFLKSEVSKEKENATRCALCMQPACRSLRKMLSLSLNNTRYRGVSEYMHRRLLEFLVMSIPAKPEGDWF